MNKKIYSEQIKEYVYSHRQELLDTLAALVAIPSVKGEPSEGAPFGKEPRRALDKMMEICASKGLAARVCGNVVGCADYSPNGEAALGILSHLDVVPAEPENWHSNPYAMTERDGVLYGRGVIDDKGPAAAALLAVCCVKELGIPLKKGVRLIYGTDEENGSEDMEIYRAEERLPEMVFTPDGSFPIINIEKGMMRSRFVGRICGGADAASRSAVNGKGSVRSFRGGSIPNAVPDAACAVVEGIALSVIEGEIADDNTGAVFTAVEEAGGITINCRGRSAHASTPESGINAVTALISLLNRLPLENGKQREILRGLESIFPFGETDGAAAGLKCAEEKAGALTCVFSVFHMDRESCGGTVDVRFPLCANLDFVEKAERAAFAKAGCEFDGFMGSEPHCVDENSDFVQALLRVYERVEGEKGRCIAIGGGTYVHDIPGGVAFGVERGDTDYHMHGADEFITVEELLKDAVLFAEVIAELLG